MERELTEGGRVLSASQGLTSAETQSSMAEGGDGRDPPTDLTCGPWREGGPDSRSIFLFWPIQAPTPGTAMIPVSQPSSWKSGSSPRPAGPDRWGWDRSRQRQGRTEEAACVCSEPSSLRLSERTLFYNLTFLSISEVLLKFAFTVELFLSLSWHPMRL